MPSKNIVYEASKSVKDIKSVYIKDMQVTVKDTKLQQNRFNAKVTFEVR